MIADHYDHFARVWRLHESRGEAARQVVRQLVPVSTDSRDYNAAIRRLSVGLGRIPAGVTNVGTTVVLMDCDTDVQSRDVIEVYGGPDAPLKLEVEAVSRPQNMYVKAHCKLWSGNLPSMGEFRL